MSDRQIGPVIDAVAVVEADGSLPRTDLVIGALAGAGKVLIDVATLETLAHGVAFARDVAQTLHVHFNDPAMQRTQQKIHEAQREAMRLVGEARRPK